MRRARILMCCCCQQKIVHAGTPCPGLNWLLPSLTAAALQPVRWRSILAARHSLAHPPLEACHFKESGEGNATASISTVSIPRPAQPDAPVADAPAAAAQAEQDLQDASTSGSHIRWVPGRGGAPRAAAAARPPAPPRACDLRVAASMPRPPAPPGPRARPRRPPTDRKAGASCQAAGRLAGQHQQGGLHRSAPGAPTRPRPPCPAPPPAAPSAESPP